MSLSKVIGVFSAVIGLLSTAVGCTTNISTATKAYDRGEFQAAADQIDVICPTVVTEGKVTGITAKYDRDRFWVTLEKGKMLADAGRGDASYELLQYLSTEVNDEREIRSWYEENPWDLGNWDARKFTQDVGQTVLGADQTSYSLQPYEMILLRTYLCLEALLSSKRGADSDALGAVKLQQYERVDLEKAGYEVMQPPLESMDGAVRGNVPSGKTTDFGAGTILTLGEFQNAKKAMKDAIESAKKFRAADPRVAFSSVVQWATHMQSNNNAPAMEAAKQVALLSGAQALSDRMMQLTQGAGYREEWVLVLVDVGRGPIRGSFNVRLPIIIPTVGGTMFRAVYPYLKFRADDRPTSLVVEADGQRMPADLLTSIDAVAARNFQRREAELWWAPTLRAAARAIVTIVAQAVQSAQAKNNNQKLLGQVLIGIGGALVAEAEQPDLRMWSTLPAAQHAAIVRRPADGRVVVRIDSPVGSGEVAAQVPPGASVMYVRALNAGMHIARVGTIIPKDRMVMGNAASAVTAQD